MALEAAVAERAREQRQYGGFAEVPRMHTTGRGRGSRESKSVSRINRLLCGGKFGMVAGRVCMEQKAVM